MFCVFVAGPGVSIEGGQEASVASGDTLRLRCSVTKTSSFKVTRLDWRRNGAEVHGSTTDYSQPSEVVTSLIVQNVATEAAGDYTCYLTGEYRNQVSGTTESITGGATGSTVSVQVSPRSSE